MIGLHEYLFLGLTLFVIGMFGVLTRRNAVGILIGIELMFNGANVNLAAFSRFVDNSGSLTGQVFAVFVITVAAAEAVVGLALILAIYRHVRSAYVEQMNVLRG